MSDTTNEMENSVNDTIDDKGNETTNSDDTEDNKVDETLNTNIEDDVQNMEVTEDEIVSALSDNPAEFNGIPDPATENTFSDIDNAVIERENSVTGIDKSDKEEGITAFPDEEAESTVNVVSTVQFQIDCPVAENTEVMIFFYRQFGNTIKWK